MRTKIFVRVRRCLLVFGLLSLAVTWTYMVFRYKRSSYKIDFQKTKYTLQKPTYKTDLYDIKADLNNQLYKKDVKEVKHGLNNSSKTYSYKINPDLNKSSHKTDLKNVKADLNKSTYKTGVDDVKADSNNRIPCCPANRSQSYNLWKSIRLYRGEKYGRCRFHRYGEALKLYIVPRMSPRGCVNKFRWCFERKSNDFVNCEAILLNSKKVSGDIQQKITEYMRDQYRKHIKQASTSCKDFVKSAGYITDSLTQMEAEFPIAFSIVMYKDVEQFEILLRTIYRPQNVYCIHVDKKSPQQLHEEVKIIANCFDNVFVTEFNVNVTWSTFTNLEPEVICLRELWKHHIKWKYFIDLTGQELPLRTNYELVKILMSFDGANNVESDGMISKRMERSGPPPYGLTPVQGALHVTLSRAFVDFVLHNETSLALLEWSRKVVFPEEHYFSTLNYNRQLRAPGAYKGEPQSSANDNPFITRLKHWQFDRSSCHGKIVRSICIFGIKDLPLLATREELFANKFHFGYYPEVMLCMQELLYNRTADEYEGLLDFNVTYYATRDFVKNRF